MDLQLQIWKLSRLSNVSPFCLFIVTLIDKDKMPDIKQLIMYAHTQFVDDYKIMII